jgi:hypothetical protein
MLESMSDRHVSGIAGAAPPFYIIYISTRIDVPENSYGHDREAPFCLGRFTANCGHSNRARCTCDM